MKSIIKRLLKKTALFKYAKAIKEMFDKYKRVNNTKINKLLYLIKLFITFRMYKYDKLNKMFKKIKIEVDNKSEFVYSIDTSKRVFTNKKIIGNITIDYERLLKKSLKELNNEENVKIVDAIEKLIDRTIKELMKSDNKHKDDIINNLNAIKERKANTFKEALQRILFYNQLLWQTGHRLNGLGRLDKILYPYYKNDISNNIITKEDAKKLMVDFCNTLHKYYWYKSNVLMGDTGQIIVLGGLEENGEYFCNELTYIFIEIMEELKLPEPKVLLRVANNMPRDLMELSLRCIQTGIGCPLFSNDEIVIPLLIKYGYDIEDVYDYVTAACWEPIMPRNNFEQTNVMTINFLEPFNKMLDCENLSNLNNEDKIVEMYNKYIEEYAKEIFQVLDKMEWQDDALLSLFTEQCNTNKIDIAQGGAKYNHYGVNSVGLANTVDSILNIKRFVFEKEMFTLEELENARKNGFSEDIIETLKNQKIRFGKDEEEVIELTNKITKKLSEVFETYTNKFGGKLKFGLSSPGYISQAQNFAASLDGRNIGEPFNVHISSSMSEAHTELIQFASKLEYSGSRFNGNVVDFIVSPTFIQDNFDKFVDLLLMSIKVGFFQMQMNVVDSKTLIRAKEHPEEFPNLIVRVWGFSAYFNDLPEEYKKVIIERTILSERRSN